MKMDDFTAAILPTTRLVPCTMCQIIHPSDNGKCAACHGTKMVSVRLTLADRIDRLEAMALKGAT